MSYTAFGERCQELESDIYIYIYTYIYIYIHIYINSSTVSCFAIPLDLSQSLEVAFCNRHSSLQQLDGREDEVNGPGSLSVNNTMAVVDEKVINSSTVSCFAIPLDLSQSLEVAFCNRHSSQFFH